MESKRCAGLTSWVHLDEKIEETGAAPLSVSRRAVQASDSTRALRSPIVHWSWGSGLGLPPAPLLVGRSLRPGAVAERPCLRLQSFTASSDLPTSHTCVRAHKKTHCMPLCLLANKTSPGCSAECLFVMQGVQWSPNTDLGVTRWPKFAEARTATARTRPDRSFHGMMDQALKLLLSSSTAARSAD